MYDPDKVIVEPDLKNDERRPSCLLEAVLFVALFVATLAGLGAILGPYLDNLFQSVFGMGLK